MMSLETLETKSITSISNVIKIDVDVATKCVPHNWNKPRHDFSTNIFT